MNVGIKASNECNYEWVSYQRNLKKNEKRKKEREKKREDRE